MVYGHKPKTKKPDVVTKKAASKPAKGPDNASEKEDVPGVGHNSGVSGSRLKSFVERVERLMEEKAAIADDIKDVYAEAGASGFDKKIVRKVVSLRRMDAEKRREEQELIELYCAAIGLA